MKLKLNGLEVACIIGDLPEERERVQTLRIDVELEISDRAAETDALADTVDYAALAARIRAALREARCRMIERAARVVYDVCRREKLVRAARVAVRKSGAIAGLSSAEVVYDGR